jgi:hypothetical protein
MRGERIGPTSDPVGEEVRAEAKCQPLPKRGHALRVTMLQFVVHRKFAY